MKIKHKNTIFILLTFIVIVQAYFLYKATENQYIASMDRKYHEARFSKMPLGDNPVLGQDTSSIKILVYIDYQCQYSLKFIQEQLPLLNEAFIKKGLVQVVFKDYPLYDNESSLKLARSAHIAYKKGVFERFLKNVLAQKVENEAHLSTTTMLNLAGINKEIARNKLLAGVAGINSTPSFIINRKLFKGMMENDKLIFLIEQLLAGSK